MCGVSKGEVQGPPEKRAHEVSRTQNRYVRLPLMAILIDKDQKKTWKLYI